MENKKNNLLKILIVAIILIFAINISLADTASGIVKQKVAAGNEAKRPANISISIIKDPVCSDCADITSIINAVKNTNAKITSEEIFEANSQRAKDLINEFGIKKLPSFIIRGELNKNANVVKLLSQIGEIKNDAFIFNYSVAPYLDLASNTVKGKVTVTFINDKDCAECYDINPFKQILANNIGMINSAIVTLDKSDKAAQALIKKYKIIAAPMFVLSGEVSEYPNLTGIWLQIGTLEKDGAFVLRDIKKVNPNLIYRDLATGKIVKPVAAQTPVSSPAPK